MTLRIYTSTYRYKGPNRLDITVKGQDPTGSVFAPTWTIVRMFKEGKITWEQYKDRYHKLMFKSYGTNRQIWEEVLMRDEIVLVCFCPNYNRCHRVILAEILMSLGAVYKGEI